MLDREAIQELAQAEAISAAQVAVDAAMDDAGHGFVGLPDAFKLHDLERNLPRRRRARGGMVTSSIANFAAYVTDKQDAGTAVFVAKDDMKAVAVLNLGTPGAPGHADDTATLALDKGSEFAALGALLRKSDTSGLTQRDVAEFLEDWSACLHCEVDGEVLETKHAIDAIRRITIDNARKFESTENNLSSERSALERVAASSAGNPLPTTIIFACAPYHGFLSRQFSMRMSVRTGDANRPTLSLTLRVAKWEQHTEEMADELATKVTEAISSTEMPVIVGSYTVKP